MADLLISRMDEAEVATAIDWAAEEGWNPGLHDAEAFFAADPTGFYAAREDGQIVGVCSVVCYDPNYAFAGLFIVPAERRGEGIGMALANFILEHAGDHVIGGDAVMEMQEKYAKIGFQMAYQNMRYEGNLRLEAKSSDLLPLSEVDVSELLAYDHSCFLADRAPFLEKWISLPGYRGLAYVGDGGLEGYGLIRPCRSGHKIGPLFADSPAVADKLFQDLVAEIPGETFYLDIPLPNTAARELVKRYEMQPVFGTGRMYRGQAPDLPLDRIFGVTTLELG